ncbi:LytR/AlgR family response regulator transcription factor [Aureivirga sp. CE67]|uniref:LytR/AlgR family response regulator transcription factor n=1 Tax=Aureivirga sp. CE67 TaxID=1788983 RepID=UPI001E60EEF1|nr:LytTR family DNA-binding domain-containing protein [Aureivirga sp. CE67]
MYKIAIIEDEAPARKKLKLYIEKLGVPYEIITELETVDDTLDFLKTNPEVDVIFSDIELRDGNVFDVYSSLTVKTPIIFSTAYNDFWMNAFETNGIEYLLKPYTFVRFEKAWNKFQTLKDNLQQNQQSIFKELDSYFQQKNKPIYKDFISVKTSNGIYFLKTQEIAYFQADHGVVFAFDQQEKKHLLNQNSLTSIQEILDPELFFKINRGELVNKNFVERINRYNKNTVSITLKNLKAVLKTSQTTTATFNSWMGV